MASNQFRNGDSGAQHSRDAQQQRQSRDRMEDATASTRPNQTTVREVQQRKR